MWRAVNVHEPIERGGASAPVPLGLSSPSDEIVSPAAGQRLLVLLKQPGAAEAAVEIARRFPDATTYATLPIAVLALDSERSAQLATIPGVHGTVALPASFDRAETLIVGFDALRQIHLAARAGDGQVGGMRAEDGGYPVLVRGQDGWRIEPDLDLGLDTAAALMPVINFSIGTTSIRQPALPHDPINVTTAAVADDQLIVAAAGNSWQREDRETLSAWAEMPWVLSVGATDDEAGTKLWERSSAGVAGDPTSGPDVVAWAVSRLDPSHRGTSFAAPRVTGLAMLATAAILQLRHHHLRLIGTGHVGVQLVGSGVIDDFSKGWWSRPRLDVPALPIVGVDTNALARVLDVATRADVALEVQGRPRLVREMVLASARPVAGAGPHLVGAGFVSDQLFLDWLAARDGSDLVRWFGDRPVDPPVLEELARHKLFHRHELALLGNCLYYTKPGWAYDFVSRRLGVSPTAVLEEELT